MLDMSAEDFRRVVDIDLNAPFIVSKACLPGMIAKDGAEGVYAAGLPDGRGIAIKITDGGCGHVRW